MATITLHRLIQDSQNYGSNDEHMVSRVFFDLTIDGKKYEGLFADVKQSVGSSFESSAVEVSSPSNYKGPFNHDAFSNIVVKYYRSLVGASGSGIHIQGGSNIRVRNNTVDHSFTDKFQVTVTGGSW